MHITKRYKCILLKIISKYILNVLLMNGPIIQSDSEEQKKIYKIINVSLFFFSINEVFAIACIFYTSLAFQVL